MPAIRNAGTMAGTAKRGSTLAKPGQFTQSVASLTGAQRKVQQPVVRLTGATKPQFIQSNGSSGATGKFGAMLPRVSGGTKVAKSGQFGAGVGGFSVSKPNAVTRVVANAMSGISKLGGTAGLAQQMGYARQPLSGVNPTIGRQATVQRGTFAGTDPRQIPSGFNRPVVKLTGQPNTVGVNQYNYLTPQQKSAWDAEKRRQQINQLTAPYTGSLAALTGANMVEPVNQGFPGTDPRQQVQVSDTWGRPAGMGAKIQGVPWSDFADTYGNTTAAAGGRRSGGGGGGGYGYDPYGYSDPYSGGGSYGSTPYSSWGDPVGNILNWRVATG